MVKVKRNREKLKKLVHYIADRCEDPSTLGSIKLNKVLWVSDLSSYLKTGESITGEQYIKQQFGPVPGSIVGILQELQTEKKLVVRTRESNGYSKTDYISLKSPEKISDTFTAEEISMVETAMDFVCAHTAMEISDRTHNVIWELAEIGEEIPYEAAFASRLDGVTKEDVTWAKNAHDAALTK